MSDALLVILIIIGILVLYWVLFGQWKHNQRMRELELARIKKQIKKKKKK